MLQIYILHKFYRNIICLAFNIEYYTSFQEVICLFVLSHIYYAVTDHREFTRQAVFVELNIEARSRNKCRREKTYYIVCVCVYVCMCVCMYVYVCMYVCSVSYSACKAHASCFIVTCGLSGCAIFFPFTT